MTINISSDKQEHEWSNAKKGHKQYLPARNCSPPIENSYILEVTINFKHSEDIKAC